MERKCHSWQKKAEVEIWGGIECTINRVNDHYRDQLEDTGHYNRKKDIDILAATGIRRIRYPVLWEKHQPNEKETPNFDWAEKQLDAIKKNKLSPIVGLLHHGSGPKFTNLLDPLFPYKFMEYAKLVATKFPWVEYYTPVNEPLTTARFSGLYGIWYPHKKEPAAFIMMLLHQMKATVLAMKEIRKINPHAKLVQTEDLTKIQSTALLQYQADFENERRWLTYDLLCGRVDRSHPLWPYFRYLNIPEEELIFFIKNTCEPAIIGCNYYLTSERFLDEHIDQYPQHCRGNNGKHCYADAESVRVNRMLGLKALLKEVWKRYQIPIAVTEVHLHCTREEQIRWMMEAWDTCTTLKTQGVDMKALTAWAMLGSYDWNTLITEHNKHYESGAFDIREGIVRKTVICKVIESLSAWGNFSHPVLEQKGWWHNENKYVNSISQPQTNAILIIGKNGTLGKAFSNICGQRSLKSILLSRQELDICDEKSIRNAINQYKPWAIINTAGYVRVDEAESAADECLRINAYGAGLLAKVCNSSGIKFMTFSSDMVFDGNKQAPYTENDNVNPVNTYGLSKAKAEELVLKEHPGALIIRTSSFFGPWDSYNFAYCILQKLAKNESCIAFKNVFISPTYVPDLVHTALDIFIDEEKGIWHITNDGCTSWSDIAAEIAERAGYKRNTIQNAFVEDINPLAKRPLYSAMQSARGIKLSSIDNAISRYFSEKIV